jgi:D-alanyl-lipoteichoic acid acyltransferase DltB (MBOAT superfamily)
MLFNSQGFLLIFLPLTLLLYFAFAKKETLRIWVLISASLFFYAYWDLRFLPLLVISVTFNWFCSKWHALFPYRSILIAGVAVNLLIIGFFKYTNFLLGNVAATAGAEFAPWNIVLPLGISFFTFQQISYLVDLKRGTAPIYPFHKYVLYVTFFPQLIAGPIVRHNEIIKQYAFDPFRDGVYERLSKGFGLLFIGLFKKMILADTMAETASFLFNDAAAGNTLSFYGSWVAAAAYTLQIYYDFSGYSDMAIGLGFMFGLTIPINFNAPYLAISIRDFWRRWHITLSRFLRDYLYIPMGGNRYGPARQVLALMVTMLLGGLWHGAGWTFVIWGGLHGLALVLNHLWEKTGMPMPRSIGWVLTVTFVMFGWVIFRADNLETASAIMQSMVGINGFSFNIPAINPPGQILYYALPAFIGPTSQRLATHWLRPRPIYAVIVACALFYLALRAGDGNYSEFIYFQF